MKFGKNISIVGDSFGCGEWTHDSSNPSQPKVSHTGIHYYLTKQGYSVKNYSFGGASSTAIINQIKQNNIRHETVLVFATDSLRGYREQDTILTQLYLVKNYSIKKTHKLLFQEWIENLNQISTKQKCQLILIGGHANLYQIDFPKNFKICTLSWLTDICGKPIGDLAGIDSRSIETFITMKSIQSDQDKQEIIDIMTQRSNRLNLMFNNPAKFPDHLHPSRSCHEQLSEKIINLLG